MMPRKKVAIVGSGVAGLVAAHLTWPRHDMTLFEADDRLGGHVNTIPVSLDGREYAVDVGFVVYNERNYPHFTALLERLGVVSMPTQMSFSVRSEAEDLEYNGGSLRDLFAQRRNAYRPAFLRMLWDILRFNREARAIAAGDMTPLGTFLRASGYSRVLRDWYLLPMVGCIWSAPRGRVSEFPIGPLAAFLRNHGLLDVLGRPTWRVVCGGASRYVDVLVQPFRDRIRQKCAVRSVSRTADRVEVTTDGGQRESFDEVVIASHGDRVLDLLANPTPEEREAFAPFHYEDNSVVVHTDDRLMPRRPRAGACWNALVPASDTAKVCVTYDMNRLQSLGAASSIFVTLNADDRVDPDAVIERLRYRHPVMSAATMRAAQRVDALSGNARIHYCGAYLGYGFHEDGVVSAMRVADRLLDAL